MEKKVLYTGKKYSTSLEKLIYIFLFSLILYNLVLLNSLVSVGYRINIFEQVPYQFWCLLIITYAIGSFQLLQRTHGKFKIIGIFIILINYVLFLLLPYRLGYYIIGNSDELTYLGETYSIINTSHINISDIYPATQVFYSITSLISGVEAHKLSTILPSYFSIVFVLGIIAFSISYFKSKFFIYNSLLFYLLFPVSTIYYFRYSHFSVAPNGTFFTFFPIFLLIIYKYTFVKENRFSFSILSVILSLIIPFSHPFVILMVVYVVVILSINKNKFQKILKDSTDLKNLNNLIILMAVTITLWVISNQFFTHTLVMYSSMTQTVAGSGINTVKKANEFVNLSTILKILLYLFGRYFIPLVIIFIATVKIFVSKNDTSKHTYDIKYNFKKCAILFLLFSTFDLFLLINPFVTHTIDRLSTLNFFVFAQIPFFVLSLYYLFLYNKTKTGLFVTIIILSVIYYLSIFGSLSSPNVFTPNTGVTVNEVTGMQWWFTFKNESLDITSPLNPDIGSRYRHLLQGWGTYNGPTGILLPPHFGYVGNEKFKFKNMYIAIIGYDELLYSSVFVFEKNKEKEGYSVEDFSRFRNDSNVKKIYDSLDIELYKT